MYSKLRKYCNFVTKNSRCAWHVILAQEVKNIKISQIWLFSRTLYLTTCTGNWLWTITSDWTAIIGRFLFELVGMMSVDRNYREVINLFFVLPVIILKYIYIYIYIYIYLKLIKYCNFGRKKFSTCVARHSSALEFKSKCVSRESTWWQTMEASWLVIRISPPNFFNCFVFALVTDQDPV